MANSLETVVRVTYNDLIEDNKMEKKMNELEIGDQDVAIEKKKKKEHKRPSRAIYQPGVSRLSRIKDEQNSAKQNIAKHDKEASPSKDIPHSSTPAKQNQSQAVSQPHKPTPTQKSDKMVNKEENVVQEKSKQILNVTNPSSAPQKSDNDYKKEENIIPDNSKHFPNQLPGPQRSHRASSREDTITLEKSKHFPNQLPGPQRSHKASSREENITQEKSQHFPNQPPGPQKPHRASYKEEITTQEKSKQPQKSHRASYTEDFNSGKSKPSFGGNNQKEACKFVNEDNSKSNMRVLTQVFTQSGRHGGRGVGQQYSNNTQQQSKPKPPALMDLVLDKKDLKPFGRGRGRGDHTKYSNSKPQSPKSRSTNVQTKKEADGIIKSSDDNQTNTKPLETDNDRLTITFGVGSKQRQVTQTSSNQKHKSSDPVVPQPILHDHQVIPVPSENWHSHSDENVVKVLSENWQAAEYNNQRFEANDKTSDDQIFVRSSPESVVKIESENILPVATEFVHALPEKHQTSIEKEPGRGRLREDERQNTTGMTKDKHKKMKDFREEPSHVPYQDMKLSITVNKNVREVRNVSNVSRSRNNSDSEQAGKRIKNSAQSGRRQREEWNRGEVVHTNEDWKRGEVGHRHGKNDGNNLNREPANKKLESEQSLPRGGGILKLPNDNSGIAGSPPKVQHQGVNRTNHTQYNQHDSRPQRQQEHRGRTRRGDQSRLWDPNRPKEKPAISSKKHHHDELQFHDPDEENHYEYRNMTEFEGHSNQYGVYNQLAGPTNWADQVESGYSPLPQDFYQRAPPQPSPEYIQQTQALQTLHRDSAKRLLRDAERYRDDLRKMIDLRLNSEERLAKVFETRSDLEQQYEGVVLLDLNLCHENCVEQILWKYAYHQVIEALRTEMQDQEAEEVAMLKSSLLKLLDNGTSFYEGLIAKLQSSYGFNLQQHTTCLDPLHSEKTRKIKLCLLSAQRCMIALGDLARYKEHANDTSNFGKARSWYLKAQQLAPRNGRPYNQLALLALNTRRKLDAVYYYIRSLEASNPFESARESLNTLFEEVRRKVAFTEQSKMEEHKKKMILKRQQIKQHNNELNARREVWIGHDGHRVEETKEDLKDADNEIEDLARLTPVELNKRFVVSFLNVHGKLFTKIGMETFTMAVEGLLNEFAGLLNHSPPPINSTRLLQLMAINMFSIKHTGYKDSKDTYHYGRTPLQEQAIQVGLQMFALLLNSCTPLIKEHIRSTSNEGNVLNEDLRELLPGVKVWADWMMSHILLWEQPLLNPSHYSVTKDVWEEIANLLNVIIIVDSSPINFSLKKEEGWQEVVLPEDAAMAGFVPLQTIPLQPFYLPPGQDKIPAMDKVRVNALVTWGNILEGQERPLIAYSASNKQYYSCAPLHSHPALPTNDVNHDFSSVEEDVILEGEVYEDDEREEDGNIKMLKQTKEQLQRKLEEQNRKEREIEAIVESHRTQRQLILEIAPIYLVADTNCFIDHLHVIQSLVETKRYTLVVPLVVINELDGLSKGGRDDATSGHILAVQKNATTAVEYLEDEFEKRNRHIRALTAQGNILQSISIRTEEASNKGNNDDLILNCCVFYCSDKARDYMPKEKDAPIYLRREVVLLTEDRNLRVKALNRNVPVKDIVNFSKWAKIKK
ncbi:telomerase-binding protein EST1A-like [Antedon mediterranea]|uniref:telomerase-binding protein EST1A-like n=1 Tax=Antedon mediterranea TaxID=105859 RepID=UPI003AF7B4A9